MKKGRAKKQIQFDKALVSSYSHPIAPKEVLERLTVLHTELSALENVDPKELDPLNKEFMNTKLINSSNMGVQTMLLCCITDALRLYAPNCPYNTSQLTKLFNLIISNLKQLGKSSNKFESKQIEYLENLSNSNSIVLISETDNSNDLIEAFFEISYSVEVDEALDPLVNCMNSVIQSANNLSTTTLNLIFYDKSFDTISVFLLKENSTKFSRLLIQLFSDRINTKQTQDDTEDEKQKVKSLKHLKKFHNLLVKLWTNTPDCLNAIIGLLNDEMMSDEEDLRILATQTISKMVQHNSFIQKFNEVYLNWLKKTLDKSSKVRLYWIQSLDDILNTPTENNDITSDIINGLSKTLIDSNEKIRLATILKLQQLKKSMLLNAIINKDNNSILMTLIQLMRDKNWEIRAASISMVCKVYYDFTLQDEATEQLVNRNAVDCIPDEVLKLIYINNSTINSLLDINLFTYLIPVFDELPIEQHLNNLLKLLSKLTEKSKSALWAILRRQLQYSSALNKILHELDNEKIVSKLISWLTTTFPPEYNATKHLTTFFQARNKRFIRLLKLMTDSTSDSVTIVNSIRELLNRVKTDYKSNDGVNSIKLLLYRSGYLVYNKSILTALIKFMNSKDQKNILNDQASDLLDYVSKINPEILKSISNNLIENLQDLKPVFNFINKFPDTKVTDLDDYISKLKDIAFNSVDPKQVKYAVRLISKLELISIDDLIDNILPLDLESSSLNNSLAIIAEIYLQDGELLNKYTKSITSSIASNILLSSNLMSSSEIEDEETWLDDNLLQTSGYQFCNSKLLTLRIFTNYLRSSSKSVEDSTELAKLAQPIIKLFSSIITNGGEIVSSTSDTPKNFQSRLRLEAGFQMLKLFEIDEFKNLTELVNLSVMKLIFLIQDESSKVRQLFMEKLKTKLSIGKLSMLRFAPLVFFIAHEPNLLFKNECTKWIRSNLKRLQTKNYGNALIVEKIYVRFISLLARHAELVELTENQDFTTFNKFAMTYIIFILEQVSNEENISVLNYLTQLFKYYKLKDSEDSIVLYRISDLSQMILKMYCTYKTWNLVSFPNKLALPIDLFDKLGLNTGILNFKKNYLENDNKDGKLTKLIKDRFKNMNFIDNELVTPDKNDVLANREVEKENKKPKRRRNKNAILEHSDYNKKKNHHKKRHHIGDSDSEGEDDTDFKMSLKKENVEPTRKSRIKRKKVDYSVNSDEEGVDLE